MLLNDKEVACVKNCADTYVHHIDVMLADMQRRNC